MKIPLLRTGIAVCAVTAAAGALAAGALAKEGFRATLTSPIPADARPGSTITVTWKITNGRATPSTRPPSSSGFAAPDRADATEGFASPTAHTDGAYSARVTVPKGGIAAVQIGVAGTSTDSSGKSVRSDYLFPIANPPALGRAGSGYRDRNADLAAAAPRGPGGRRGRRVRAPRGGPPGELRREPARPGRKPKPLSRRRTHAGTAIRRGTLAVQDRRPSSQNPSIEGSSSRPTLPRDRARE